MANSAEQYQDEIKLIFDEFIELMHTSAAHIEVDSQRCNGYCKISINLWKCGSCSRPLFTTFFTVWDPCDLKHLAKHMDCIQKVWKFYSTSDDSSD